MLLVVSPAKTLDELPTIPKGVTPTKLLFPKEAAELAKQLAGLNEKQLGELMDISPKLAALNVARFASFPKHAHPCGWMFRGDVYDGFDIDTLPAKALPALQQRLRILSGLYGLLRPFDLMHPYRLEMGTTLKNAKGKNLYAFWGDKISNALNKAAEEADTDILLNLASQEYSGVIAPATLKPKLINAHFKQLKGNKLQVVALFAKRARGTMARWIIEENAGLKQLPKFAEDGYQFDKELSDPKNYVFIRK